MTVVVVAASRAARHRSRAPLGWWQPSRSRGCCDVAELVVELVVVRSWLGAAGVLAFGLASQGCAPDAGGSADPVLPHTSDPSFERATHRAAAIAAAQREGAWRAGYAVSETQGPRAPGA